MTIYYILTENCNLMCSHCIRGENANVVMDKEIAKKGLQELSKRYPDAVLVLSGGEPTIYPAFSDILLYAVRIFKMVVINSNGTTDYFSKNAELLSLDNVCIQFSLDGNEEHHDAIRGAGSFSKVIKNIELLNVAGRSVWISTVVSKDNIAAITVMPSFLEKYKIGKWHVSPMMPFGKASFEKILTTSEWNALVDQLIHTTKFRLGIRKTFDMTILGALSDQRIDEISHDCRNMEFKNCGCVRSKLYVYPDMSVYGCTCLKDLCLGNLKNDGIDKIICSSNAIRILNHVPKSEICMECRYLPICNGGCYGMQYRYNADIRCPVLMKMMK